MTQKLERLMYALILAPVAPLLGLLIAWWSAYSLLPEKWVALTALTGLLLGLFADVFWLRKLIQSTRSWKTAFWMALFLFYTVGVFGMFMGVPLFNALLALPAGFVVAAKLVEQRAGSSCLRRHSFNTACFTTAVLFLVCAASAFIALASSSTPSDLQGMLGLPFEVTTAMVLALIVVGGLDLLGFNWLLTFISTHLAYRLLQPRA